MTGFGNQFRERSGNRRRSTRVIDRNIIISITFVILDGNVIIVIIIVIVIIIIVVEILER